MNEFFLYFKNIILTIKMANNFNLPIFLLFIFIKINCIRQQSLGTGSRQTNAKQWNSPKQCEQIGGKYFNPNTLQCTNCPGGMVPSGNGIECECPVGAIPHIGTANHLIECKKCENGLVKSRNGLHCVECLSPNGSRGNEGGKCPKCEDGIIQLDLAKNDSFKLVEKCTKCPQGMSPMGRNNECLECATQWECFCKNNNSSSTICAELAISSVAFSIPIFPFSTTNLQQFQSEFLWKTLRNAEYRCRLGIVENCQQLGNICVLQDYAREREGACNILEQIRTSWTTKPEIEQILPKLFYPNIEASVEIFRKNAIGIEFNVLPQRENSQLDIMAMAFDQDGIFLGQILTKNNPFLQMCPSNADSKQIGAFHQFGRFYRQKCRLYLGQIIRWNRSWNWNRGKQFNGTTFYELFIRYRDGQGQIMLHPIPVLNENIRGDQYTGIYPNRIEQIRRDSRFLLTKRFYILDIQKSLPNSVEDGQSEQILMIRAPKRINLHIHFQSNGDGRIFIPYLQISHEQYFISTNSSENAIGQTILDTEFTVEYHVDNYAFDKSIEVLMAISCSMAALWAALQTYSWSRRSGKMVIDASTIVKLLLFGAECIGNVFLCLMGAASIWLIFAYKLQSHIYYIPLSGNQENSFIAYMISATVLKGIALVHTILTLFLVQTFFIDWERPRFLSINETTFVEEENERGRIAKPQKRGDVNSVVIWRTYLIANEWNELQLYRKTDIGLQLVAMLFLMEYLEFGNWAKVQPGFERINQPNEFAETRMSRFGVDLFFYFCIGMGQWLLQVIIMERLADPFRNFMDLCSVANISVLAMTNPLRGFYIHGRSVHGFADTDMLQMNTFLQREKENLCALRGLESGSDLQTFLCNLPRLFRERVDQILAGLNTTTGGAAAAINLRGTRAAGGAANFDRTTIRMQHQAKVYGELNDFLKDFINRVDPQCGEYQVTDSRFIEDLLGIELADTSQVGTFKKDPSEMAYSSAFLYGNEWAIMSFEMLFFSLIDMLWQSRLLAAFCAYLCSKMTIQLTNVYFTHQLARSSLVDSRFLI